MDTNHQQQTTKHTRAEQSRINGAKSKGATTNQGQAKAKTGNYQHGAYARPETTVLKSENRDQYNHLLEQTTKEYDPATALEAEIVQDITDATWQIRRLKAAVTKRLNTLIDFDVEDPFLDQAVLILERRIRQSTTLRSKLILDYQRLKKLTPVIESSRAARNPESYQKTLEVRWVDRVTPKTGEQPEKAPKRPPQRRQAA